MKIDRDIIIDMISNESGRSVFAVQEVCKAMDKVFFQVLSCVTPENDKNNPLEFQLFKGFKFKGYYKPEKQKKMNFSNDNKMITISKRVNVDIPVTRNWKEQISNESRI